MPDQAQDTIGRVDRGHVLEADAEAKVATKDQFAGLEQCLAFGDGATGGRLERGVDEALFAQGATPGRVGEPRPAALRQAQVWR